MSHRLALLLTLVAALAPASVAAQAPPRPAPNPAARSAATPSETYVPCALRGSTLFPLNTPIEDANGRAIARFSGSQALVTVSGLSLGTPTRARIETGSGRGGFHLRGFVLASAIPAFTRQNVPVSAGHVWIGAPRSVRIAGASPDKLKVEHVAGPPLEQTLTAWTPCSTLSLTPGTPPGWSPDGFARGYAQRRGRLELFDAAQGSSVGVVVKSAGADAVLYFSNEQSGPWVHVERRADVVIDAWARLAELEPLPRGETMDQLATLPGQQGPARLAVPGNPRVVHTRREVPLRVAASEGAPSIGVIEPDADVYVLDVMAGWVNVMPKALDVAPLENGAFWAKKSELGI